MLVPVLGATLWRQLSKVIKQRRNATANKNAGIVVVTVRTAAIDDPARSKEESVSDFDPWQPAYAQLQRDRRAARGENLAFVDLQLVRLNNSNVSFANKSFSETETFS